MHEILDMLSAFASVLALGMAIYGLLEIGIYIERLKLFAREIHLIETSFQAQIDALRKRIERLRIGGEQK